MMKKLFISAIVATLAIFSTYGQGVVNSIECDFIQRRHSGMLADVAVSKGQMEYRKPDFLKWEYTDPFSFAIIVDGGKLCVEKNGVRKAAEAGMDRIYKEMSKLISSTVDGSVFKDGKLFRTEFSKSGDDVVATLFPISAAVKNLWSRMVIHYEKESCRVRKFEMFEVSGDYTEIEFLNGRYEIDQ